MMNAGLFIKALSELKEESNIPGVEKIFKENDKSMKALGVRSGKIFKIAKAFTKMPIKEIEKLLDDDYYEIRMGGVCIMDYQARKKKLDESDRKTLFDLYLKKHNRLCNWDFVDRAAPSVIGNYLLDKPRDILYKLVKSSNPWERRTAIVSTYTFIKKDEIDDTFQLAEILINDIHPNIHKAVGSWIREAGKRDVKRLKDFLKKHATNMPRITLRYAIEKFDKDDRAYFLAMGK